MQACKQTLMRERRRALQAIVQLQHSAAMLATTVSPPPSSNDAFYKAKNRANPKQAQPTCRSALRDQAGAAAGGDTGALEQTWDQTREQVWEQAHQRCTRGPDP